VKFYAFVLVLTFSAIAFADNVVELRSSGHGQYRYADWAHNGKEWATDLYYVGVPGNNELSACLGYQFKIVTPYTCMTTAKEDKELGAKAAASIAWEKKAWKADAYLAYFKPLRGSNKAYATADAANITRTLGKGWEAGISTGFFRQDGKWNPLAGPLVRKNDRMGFWAISYRFGPNNELRLNRVFLFKH
jgi:hypothetical protein